MISQTPIWGQERFSNDFVVLTDNLPWVRSGNEEQVENASKRSQSDCRSGLEDDLCKKRKIGTFKIENTKWHLPIALLLSQKNPNPVAVSGFMFMNMG